MKRFTNRNPDGKYVHGCLDCGLAIVNDSPATVWICKCRGRVVVQGPTVSIGPRPATATPKAKPRRFKFAMPPCAYLGTEVGDPIKVSCGSGATRMARECYCPERPVVVGKRSGEPLPNRAADNWWCSDLGPAKATTPRSIASCQTCPHRQPQLLLPAPPAERID